MSLILYWMKIGNKCIVLYCIVLYYLCVLVQILACAYYTQVRTIPREKRYIEWKDMTVLIKATSFADSRTGVRSLKLSRGLNCVVNVVLMTIFASKR